jgi:oligopeptidase B
MEKNKSLNVMLYSIVLTGFTLFSCSKTSVMNPPVAEKIEKELISNGNIRIDNYNWLKERDNPKVISYLEKENEYTDMMMRSTKKLQERLYHEIIGRIKQTDMSVPYRDNGYYYYTRYEEGSEYPVYCRKKGTLDAIEEVLLDVNEMARGHEFFQVSGISVSPDNSLLAYGVDTISRRLYTLYFKNLITHETLPDKIDSTSGSAVWADDNATIFYTLKDQETLRTCNIMKHRLGSQKASDQLVYEELDETYYTYAYKTKSKKYIIIGSSSTLSNEYRFLEASNPDGTFRLFNPRKKELEYDIDHLNDKFLIRTNLDALNFRLMETPVENTGQSFWKEVIPHRDSVLLEGFEVFNDYLVVDERMNGLTRLRVMNTRDGSEHYIEFRDQAYTAWISVNPEMESEVLRYGYSSLTTPTSTFDYNMKTREQVLLKQQEVMGGFNPDDYFAERIYATASDGVKIPISLVYRKGTVQNGNSPLLLYGYGSYGYSIDPSFSSVRLSLLDRGFIYAIAHVRGGQELGRKWYEDGKLLQKKNTFTDFIACAEFLIANNYTKPERLFAMGGSAGGLLMGAVVNMRPDLFKGVVAAVPFVDVVTTMLDEDIPLTTAEYDEWGNPHIQKYYDYILSYSPYDNVTAKAYPNMLVTAGLHDSQVQYWEPAKWVAKLRDQKTDQNLLLLHTNMEAGHSGASGRFKIHRETALEYAFMLKLIGIKE